eukprot:TRINITY_DN3648_c0_g1_i1.p3 TRINITY_DN3648_c0_g1~~TRINITY_DN3648_c0_g1_i1.p3  ORF type:complete len:112 (-),score=19.05 TRINITY_DN3648_c0_g1_i1:231-566(-)
MGVFLRSFFFFFSSRRRHTRCREVSWARRCVQETDHQVLLTPLIGVLFIVRSRYFALSVVEEYLALEGGPPSFTRSFTSTVLLWYAGSNGEQSLSFTGLSPSVVGLSRPFN